MVLCMCAVKHLLLSFSVLLVVVLIDSLHFVSYKLKLGLCYLVLSSTYVHCFRFQLIYELHNV